jgi:hypothetical protein
VALIRRAKGKCSLIRREDAGKARPVSLRPWEGRSVIAVAQEAAEKLKAGTDEADLAVQMRLSRCKLRNLLALLSLPSTIKGHLIRTRDFDGRIGERQLRALLRIGNERTRIVEFRRHLIQSES